MRNWVAITAFFLVIQLASTTTVAQDFCLNPDKFDALQIETKKWADALKNRRYADLDAHFNTLAKAYESGAKSDDEVERWFRVFSKSDVVLEPLHEEWIKKYPDSFAAYMAAATYHQSIGHTKRGSEYASNTSDTQFAAMSASYQLSAKMLDRAEQLSKKPILVIASRINLAKQQSRHSDVIALYRAGEKLDPTNMRVKAAYIVAANPKWGGSDGELEGILENARKGNLSPGIKSFVEYLVIYEFADTVWREKNYVQTIKLYERANLLCPAFEEILVNLVNLYDGEKNYTDMRRAADRYVKRRPDSGWGYARRARANYYLSNLKESMADAEKSAISGDAYGTYLLGWFHDKGKSVTPRDPAKALELYTTARQRGYSQAQTDVERLRAELKK